MSYYFLLIRFRQENKQFHDIHVFYNSFYSPEKVFPSTSMHFLTPEIIVIRALTIISGFKSLHTATIEAHGSIKFLGCSSKGFVQTFFLRQPKGESHTLRDLIVINL